MLTEEQISEDIMYPAFSYSFVYLIDVKVKDEFQKVSDFTIAEDEVAADDKPTIDDKVFELYRDRFKRDPTDEFWRLAPCLLENELKNGIDKLSIDMEAMQEDDEWDSDIDRAVSPWFVLTKSIAYDDRLKITPKFRFTILPYMRVDDWPRYSKIIVDIKNDNHGDSYDIKELSYAAELFEMTANKLNSHLQEVYSRMLRNLAGRGEDILDTDESCSKLQDSFVNIIQNYHDVMDTDKGRAHLLRYQYIDALNNAIGQEEEMLGNEYNFQIRVVGTDNDYIEHAFPDDKEDFKSALDSPAGSNFAVSTLKLVNLADQNKLIRDIKDPEESKKHKRVYKLNPFTSHKTGESRKEFLLIYTTPQREYYNCIIGSEHQEDTDDIARMQQLRFLNL
jgi:hypothetical protein